MWAFSTDEQAIVQDEQLFICKKTNGREDSTTVTTMNMLTNGHAPSYHTCS